MWISEEEVVRVFAPEEESLGELKGVQSCRAMRVLRLAGHKVPSISISKEQ